jgi:gas vesicle protein
MENKKTLTQLFDSNKQGLENELNFFSLPKDSEKIQKAVSNYFNNLLDGNLLDGNGTFRENLTQPEDYVLQCAIRLLKTQQELTKNLTVKADFAPVEAKPDIERRVLFVKTLPGTILGGVAGAFIDETWGAVLGAIAGTAVALYIATQQSKKNISESSLQKSEIDVDVFLDIVKQICESVDNLIDAFRVQIDRIVSKYENKEKPTLEKNYGSLLDQIQLLLGAFYADPKTDKYLTRLQTSCDNLSESLVNYGLEVITYNENISDTHFDAFYSETAKQITMTQPAIVKDSVVIRKGKIVKPQ